MVLPDGWRYTSTVSVAASVMSRCWHAPAAGDSSIYASSRCRPWPGLLADDRAWCRTGHGGVEAVGQVCPPLAKFGHGFEVNDGSKAPVTPIAQVDDADDVVGRSDLPPTVQRCTGCKEASVRTKRWRRKPTSLSDVFLGPLTA